MPKIVDHELYRKELLTKSFDLFAEKGYGNVTMRQIAQALGVSTGTLYHYFPSKEVLFEQLMTELTRQDILRFTEAIQGSASLPEKIREAFHFLGEHQDYYFKQNLSLADFYQQRGNQLEDQALNLIFQRSFTQVEQEVSHLLGIHDPDLTQFILAFVDGLIWQKIYGCDINYAKQGELLATMITTYLAQQNQ
jgi:AcrR family transcriptional regulator